MSGDSKIEWTDATWNPVRGCVKVSPGCKHCYAETFAERFRGAFQKHPRTKLVVLGDDGAPIKHAYHDGFDPRVVPEALDWPLQKTKPITIFVNSMSDLFGDFVPDEYIDRVMAVMLLSPRHKFQVLTKRAERMARYFNDPTLYDRILLAAAPFRKHRPDLYRVAISSPRTLPAPWIWFGVSVEDRKYGLPRIEHLRRTPAAVRFLSIEPLLEDLGEIDLTGIHWVIVGGESGNNARPMHREWARSILRQCVAARVPFFFKQWGEWMPDPGTPGHGHPSRLLKPSDGQASDIYVKMGKSKVGRLLDGRTWDEMPTRAT